MNKEILITIFCVGLILISPLTFGYNVESNIITFESYSGKSPVIQWEKRFGGEHAIDECDSVRQTSDNGYILCGMSNSYHPYGWYDGWLVKTDANGKMIWNESYGIPDPNGLDTARSVVQTSDGGYIFCGEHELKGAWLCKIDCNGGIEWDKSFDVEGHFNSVQQTSDGGYVVGGFSGSGKALLMKTDANGTEQWRSLWAFGKNINMVNSVDVTSDYGFVLTGWYSPYDSDYVGIFLVKTDSDGVEEFHKTFQMNHYYQKAESVRQTSDGGYILVGSKHLEITPSLVLLIKTDGEGNETWNRTYYCSFSDRWFGEDVQLTDDEGFIIIAKEGWAYADASWLIKTDADGDVLWDLIIGGFGYNNVWLVSVQQTSDGGFILGGAVDEINSTFYDYYLMKINMIDDSPPDKPELDGPSSGKIYVKHTFTASTSDPDGDDVYYIFDWNDDSNSGWLGPYKSGEEITASHRWTTYELDNGFIRVRAKDSHNVMSEWSEPIHFTVPRNRITDNFLLLRLLERIPILDRLLNQIR